MKTFIYFAIVGCIPLVLSSLCSAGERFIVTTGTVSKQVHILPETQVAIEVSAFRKTGDPGRDVAAERDKGIADLKSYIKKNYGESGLRVLSGGGGLSTGPKGNGASGTVSVVFERLQDPQGVLDYAAGREGINVLWTSTQYSGDEAREALVGALGQARMKAEEMARAVGSSLGGALEITVIAEPDIQRQSKDNGNDDAKGAGAPTDFVTISAKVQAKFELVDEKGPQSGAPQPPTGSGSKPK